MQIPASLRSLPNQLTLARIAAIPVICVLLVTVVTFPTNVVTLAASTYTEA